MKARFPITVLAMFGCALGVCPLHAQPTPAGRPKRLPDGISLALPGKTLRLQILTDSIVRVLVSPAPAVAVSRPSIAVLPRTTASPAFKITSSPGAVSLTTAKLRATVDTSTGQVHFLRPDGTTILAEAPNGHTITPASVASGATSEQTFNLQQQWLSSPGESLYGLGQQQIGALDIKGLDLDMWQHNTNVVVPFLVSSLGYGILWDNTSFSRFGDLRPFTPIPADAFADASSKPGALTLTALAPGRDGATPAPTRSADLVLDWRGRGPGTPRPGNSRWEGTLTAPTTGDYQFRAFSNGGIKLYLDNKLVMSHWRQAWLTADDQIKLHLSAGQKVAFRLETDAEEQSTMHLLWKTPAATDSATSENTSLWSQVGDRIDYYFVYGPALDDVIAGYRNLTGKATMMPNWIFGLWQSRQRYETDRQSLDVVKEFRARQISFDNIVQDWQYWHADAWGSHQFDPARFPDPNAWIKNIHDLHSHLMISVWGKFNPNTDNAKEMDAHGFLYQPNIVDGQKDWIGFPYTFYDAFNPGARKLFWSQINKNLFSRGIDAWWMDATEPDLLPSPPVLEAQIAHMNPTFLGSGARMLNGYALENASAIYDGQRSAAPNQRVFNLTRSGFAGQQRYSAATWSGDVTSTWTALAKQIPAGLGVSLSGIPYWTTDTGGYTMQRRFSSKTQTPEAQDEWRELNTRWFQFSTFTPLLRVHGELRDREMWTLEDPGKPSPAYTSELAFDHLRYQLFPYIYSLAGAVTQHDATILRPLVMDFPTDVTARSLPDEFLFGPALLVAPITEYKQRSRPVILPSAATWYDFWTGAPATTGTAEAPFDHIPVYVRAGSIIPFGPDVQYIAEKPADPITLRVYEGADGHFTLYEDDGLTFDYEHNAFAEIPITYTESTHTLAIGARKGTFPAMLRDRTFVVMTTTPTHPNSYPAATGAATQTIHYTGVAVRIRLN